MQLYDPLVLLHILYTLHLCVLIAHSSISQTKIEGERDINIRYSNSELAIDCSLGAAINFTVKDLSENFSRMIG